jgi:tol-pal system protein YbgF
MLARYLGSLPVLRLGRLALAVCLSFGAIGIAQSQGFGIPGVDNEARNAILRERQRIESLRIDFDKLRGDAQVFRTEGEAIRREADILRRDVNAVQANLDLMLRKIDAKIDDGIKPVSESLQRGVDELQVLKNAQLDLLTQLEEARKEVRELRGQVEESRALQGNQRGQMEETRTLATRQDEQQRTLLEEQRKTREMQRAMEERLNGLPMLVSEDGASFYAQTAEKKEFDNAKAVFKRANYQGARKQFDEFLLRYPHGGYAPAARFWKGNAEFLQGDYKAALITLRPLQMAEPSYQKTPEAMLAIANCYSELKDPQAARKTLEELVEQYERTEAASVARDRLSKLQ